MGLILPSCVGEKTLFIWNTKCHRNVWAMGKTSFPFETCETQCEHLGRFSTIPRFVLHKWLWRLVSEGAYSLWNKLALIKFTKLKATNQQPNVHCAHNASKAPDILVENAIKMRLAFCRIFSRATSKDWQTNWNTSWISFCNLLEAVCYKLAQALTIRGSNSMPHYTNRPAFIVSYNISVIMITISSSA